MSKILQITLAKLKKSEAKKIYYSENTLWWTDDPYDVAEATKIGRKMAKKAYSGMMKNVKIPLKERYRMENLYNAAIENPMDIAGSPIMVTDDVGEWIKGAENNVKHFGKHGITAFMMAHHKNCLNVAFKDIQVYNDLIDKLKEKDAKS